MVDKLQHRLQRIYDRCIEMHRIYQNAYEISDSILKENFRIMAETWEEAAGEVAMQALYENIKLTHKEDATQQH